MEKECPESVKKIMIAYGKIVQATDALYEAKDPSPLALYFAREFHKEMEDTLIQMLVCTVPSHSERKEILAKAKLKYLAQRMRDLEMKWDKKL